MPPLLLPQTLSDALATALYVPNYAFAAQGTDYLTVTAPSLFQHYWSLGVEEQFYLVWPALLGVCLLRAAARVLALGTPADLGSSSWRACRLHRADGARPAAGRSSRSGPAPGSWAPAGCWRSPASVGRPRAAAAAPVSSRRSSAGSGWRRSARGADASPPHGLPRGRGGAPGRRGRRSSSLRGGSAPSRAVPPSLLGRRPMHFVGRISYSLYLVHWPILLLLGGAALGPDAASPIGTLALGAAAIPSPGRSTGRRRAARTHGRPAARGAPATHPGRHRCRGRRGRGLAVAALVAITVDNPSTTGAPSPAPLPALRRWRPRSSRQPPTVAPRRRRRQPGPVRRRLRGRLHAVDPASLPVRRSGSPRSCCSATRTRRSGSRRWTRSWTIGAFQLETQTKSACPSADVKLERGGPSTRAATGGGEPSSRSCGRIHPTWS